MSCSDFDEQIARARRGDPAALTALIERFGPDLQRRFAGRIAARWQSVLSEEDVLQVTYAEAFLSIGQFAPEGPRSFLEWLTRIAENNLRDAVKSLAAAKRPPPERRAQAVDGDEGARSLLGQLAGAERSPSSLAAAGEARARLHAALKRLPPVYADVVRWYDLEQRPAEAIAQRLGRSVGAMYMLRARALDRLRFLLGHESKFFSSSS